MLNELAGLTLYADTTGEAIFTKIAEICRDFERGEDGAALRARINRQVLRILELGTLYGFDENLWHDALSFHLITCENPFSLPCEGVGAKEGTVRRLVLRDIEIFMRLFRYDFAPLEKALGMDCFTLLTNYTAIPKRGQAYFREVSRAVRALSRLIEASEGPEPVFEWLSERYRTHGAGLFGLSRAFRVEAAPEGVRFLPIRNLDAVRLSDLTGCQEQKAEMRRNVEAFLAGRPYNNMLLYGDAGTGKSTSVKALNNEYGDQGLRMIEINKHQFGLLNEVIARVKHRACRFVIFLDDLSFEENEVEYKYLKAVIEGGLESRPDNVMICATSNRRHLIRETWNDRSDMEFKGDVHRSDTMEERLSLAARFGCAINFNAPTRSEYHDIVFDIARREGIEMPEDTLKLLANRWEIRHGGLSGRTARQFVHMLAGEKEPAQGEASE